jgi:hypothetical protein
MVRPRRLEARRASLRAIAPGVSAVPDLGVLAGRHDRSGTAGGDGVMALAGVEGAIGGDAGDLRIGRIWSSGSGNQEDQEPIRGIVSPTNGASPMSLGVNSAARISSVRRENAPLGPLPILLTLVNSDVDLAPDPTLPALNNYEALDFALRTGGFSRHSLQGFP